MDEKLPLTVEVAQRMFQVGRNMPQESKDDTRIYYEAMAVEARQAIGEKLVEFADAVTKLCIEKKHAKSIAPTAGQSNGQPCPQCRQQVRYMRSAVKIVMPNQDS